MKTLIVEGDMKSQCLLAKVLAERGHEVVSYDNAEQAILAYQKEFYPLLFADVCLPGMDGLHFCKWVRAQPNGGRVFIMLATSPGRPSDMGEVLTVGANDFLPKPYDLSALKVRLTVAEKQMKEFFERKELEEGLRGSRESFQRVVKAANEGAWLLNAQFRTDYVNPQMAAILGYQVEELANRAVIDFLPESSHRDAEHLFAQQREGKEVKNELRFRRKDGSECLTSLSAAPVRAEGGEFKGSLWMVADLTGRKTLEAELADTRKKFETQVRDLTVELNKTGKLLQTESAERKKIEQTIQQARAELEARLRQQSAERGKVADELKVEVASRQKAEGQLVKTRDELAARVQEFTSELDKTKEAMQAEVHRRKEEEEALRKLRKELEKQIQQQKDGLAGIGKELKAEQAAKKQVEEALEKAYAQIELDAKHHAELLARADRTLQAETTERKRTTEVFQKRQFELEARTRQQAEELAGAERALRAEAAEHKRTAEALHKAQHDLEVRTRLHDDESAKADKSLQAEISERKRVAESLQKVQHDLEARIRELTAQLSRAGEELRNETAERKHVEHELGKAKEELAHRLKEHTAELAEVNQELKTAIAERKRVEEELLKSREDVSRRVREHMAEMVQAGDELKAALTERKKAEETLKQEREGAELRVNERTNELAKVREQIKAETAERHKLEQHLPKVREELEGRLKERVEEMAKLNDELKQHRERLTKAGDELKNEIAAHQRAEVRSVAFLKLGKELGAAHTPNDAARVIAGVAHELSGWDACSFDLYSAEENRISPILNIDTVNGRPAEVPPTYSGPEPSPIMQRVIKEGAQLILRSGPSNSHTDYLLFGDRARLSASLMYVPIRGGTKVVGFLSVQSYAPGAYDQEDLDTLQALADHCGAALERIRAEETMRRSTGDITERPRLEAQQRQAQKMESIGQLAAGVAHDFNNLLGVVQGYSTLLMEEKDIKPEMAEALKQIASAIDRASHLTRQLLIFSRKQVIHVRNIDLNELINNVGKLLRRAVSESIVLQFNYSPNLPAVEADTGMMEQVVMNLAVNARDAMPEGGQLIIGTKAVAVDEAHVRHNPEARVGRFICLAVTDTGCGMDEPTLERIFEPFFSTKIAGKGTGLGLATVYGIVKQHQGWLEVQSRIGHGTTFTVFLPAGSRTVAAPPQTAERPAVRGGTETILLVEDEPAVLIMAKGILQRLGYQVMGAASGDEAVPIWQQHSAQINLLLTDMVMPGSLSGRELAEKLLQEKPGLKVVYASGYSMDLVGPGLATSKNFIFLQKPYHPEALAQIVRGCLDGKLP